MEICNALLLSKGLAIEAHELFSEIMQILENDKAKRMALHTVIFVFEKLSAKYPRYTTVMCRDEVSSGAFRPLHKSHSI
jgi:hypothetical protein